MKFFEKTFSSDFFLTCFGVNEDKHYIRKLSFYVRILFGLFFIHRNLDILGFQSIYHNPEFIISQSSLEIFLGLCIIFGFCTPLALAVCIYPVCIKPPFAFSLGHQAAIMLCWALIWIGAGRFNSLDEKIMAAHPKAEQVFSKLYCLSFPENNFSFAIVRFMVLVMFWGVSVSAMSYHFYDPLWLDGKVLQTMMRTDYLTDHAEFFRNFESFNRGFFDLFMRGAMYVQGIWELFLLPLMFFRWGRIFVALQGFAFFIISTTCFNLGYLPLYEIALWILIFALPSFWQGVKVKVPELKLNKLMLVFVLLSTLSMASFTFFHSVGLWLKDKEMVEVTKILPIRRFFFRMFAQDQINVFNEADIGMGRSNITIYEVDDQGNEIRRVPFMNEKGRRLDYLRNDLLYFQYSLKWQRLPDRAKYMPNDPNKPNQVTMNLAYQVIRLDTCITKPKKDTNYRIRLYKRDMKTIDGLPEWVNERKTFEGTVKVSKSVVDQIINKCGFAFDLPPGH